MKLLLLAVVCALALASPYDPKNHQNGHELDVSIYEDINTVFVVMWYSSEASEEVVDMNNRHSRDIQSKLSGKDQVSFSSVDMSIPGHVDPENLDEDYSTLFAKINGKEYSEFEDAINNEGPIINVLRKQKGVRLTGMGIGDEVVDQVEEMKAAIAKDQKTAAQKQAEADEDAANSPTTDSNTNKSNSDDDIDKATEPTQGDLDDFF